MLFFGIKKDFRYWLSYGLSRLTEPFLLLLILAVSVAASRYFMDYNLWEWGIILIFCLVILPVGTILLGLRKGKVSDIDFTKRQERTPYILIILFYWILGLLLTWGLAGPKIIFSLLLTAIITSGAMLLINLFWKISGHSLGITVFGLFFNEFFGWQYWWLFVLTPIVMWARYEQKKHSLGQLAGGVGLGAVAWAIIRLIGY